MRELYGDKLTEAQVVMYIVLWYSYGTIVVCSVSSVACSANEDFTNSDGFGQSLGLVGCA